MTFPVRQSFSHHCLWSPGLPAYFLLPRLFVYHASAEDQVSRERFKIMERKLYRGIMTPSMVVVVALGSWLISFNPQYYLIESHWLHAKLTLVALLIVYHFYCGHLLKVFRDDNNQRSHVFTAGLRNPRFC